MGIEAIEVDNVKMNLGPTPVIYKNQTKLGQGLLKGLQEAADNTYAPGGITESVQIPTTGLTDEQLLMWSAQTPDQQ